MISVPQDIKHYLHYDHRYKNIRIHFPNGERSDICNNLIVKDSVSFKESLCSQNTLKFGLCESPVFECEVVGVGNIKGATIEVYCEVECRYETPDAVWKPDLHMYVYPIRYGVFIIDSCQRQADMNHRKIVAYNAVAVGDWGVGLIERTKFNFNSDYTPNMGFFFASNGVPMVQNLCDKTEVNWALSTYTRNYAITITPEIYEVTDSLICTAHCYRYTWTTSGDYDLYRCGLKSDAMARKAEIQAKADRVITARGLLTEAHVSQIKAMCLPHFCLFRDNENGTNTGEFYYAFGTFENIYPYINNFYSNGSYTTRMYYYVPADFTVTRRYRWMDPVTHSYTYREVDILHFDYTLTGDTKLYKLNYKSDYSYLRYYKFNFPVLPQTINGKTVYKPVYDEFDMKSQAEAFVNLFGMMAMFTRDGGAALTTLKRQFNLAPGESLYPGSGVYPSGVTGGSIYPKDYQTCWYDDEYSKPFGLVTCLYKDSNNDDNLFNLYLTGFDENSDPDSYKTYDLSDNAIIKAGVWTLSEIQNFCEIIAGNIEGVSYMPVDFVGRGLPYVEAGDTFEILTRSNDSITTIVLDKTTTGEQTLTDSYKSV